MRRLQFEETWPASWRCGHIFLLHPDEIFPLAALAGLEVEELRVFANPLTSGHLGTERLLRVLPRQVAAACERLTGSLPFMLRSLVSSHIAVRFRRPA